MSMAEGLPLPKALRLDLFPLDRLDPGGDLTAFLSRILVTDWQEAPFSPGPGGQLVIGLTVDEELVLELVGLNGFALVIGGASATTLTLGAEMRPDSLIIKLGGGVRLRFPRSVLKPVLRDGDAWVDDPSRPFAEIVVNAGVVIDQDWNVTFDGANAFTLAPAMIADSGFVIEGSVALDFSETTGLPESAAIGLPVTWRGVVFRTLTVHLPEAVTEAVPIASVAFESFHIGSGGVSGRIRLNGAPGSGMLAGFPFSPTAFEVTLAQNALTETTLTGRITLPFFDAPLDVTAGFDLDGNFTVALANAGGAGLVTLDKPGLLSVSLERIGFARSQGRFIVSLGGTLTPKVGGLDWPGVRIEELSIDSDGRVLVEGGWIDLPDQYVLNLSGFQIAISRIGFGTETDGRRWLGFNGALKLVEGLSAGASVEGLRIRWSPGGAPNPSLTLEGVGVEFSVPGSVSFKGYVSMREPQPGVVRFDGAIELKLEAIGLTIDGQLVIGFDRPNDYTFFAVYIGVELPAGIPLWSTGLGLYGLAGLFALNMEPGRAPDEPWYGIQPGPSWYHRSPPGVGVAVLRKWTHAESSVALGGGVTIGSVYDNGFTFAGRMLLALVFPGPILLIEGRSNVLKPRASLSDEPNFRTLLVIDSRAGTVTAGIDAVHNIADGGELIDIHGALEAFFGGLDDWHLYLGIDEPRTRRIGADIFFRIFHGDSYFMLDPDRVRMGAWSGIEKDWRFGPLRVHIEAWLEGRAQLSFKPIYFQGSLALHGGFGVSVFGFGFDIGASAIVSAGVFDPFFIRADFNVSVGLPWPLPDFSVDFSLEWGPESDPPLLPVPVKEVAIGHDIASVTWPLPAGSLLLPALDAGSPQPDFFADQPPALPAPDAAPPPAAQLPVVPLDGRPEITFGRSVHDDANTEINARPQYAATGGWSRIGDPARNEGPALIRPALAALSLDRWTGTAWEVVARSNVASGATAPRKLYGAWMPVPPEPGGGTEPGQTKLRVWSKTPFSYARRTSQSWTDQFLVLNPHYPCIQIPKDREICCDFTGLEPGDRPAPPWSCPGNDAFLLTWAPLPPAPVVSLHDVQGKPLPGLCLPAGREPQIVLLREAKRIEVLLEAGTAEDRATDCLDFTGRRASRSRNPREEAGHLFTAFSSGGNLAPASVIRTTSLADGTKPSGLDVAMELRIKLAQPARAVRLLVSTGQPPLRLAAIDTDGKPVGQVEVRQADTMQRIDFNASGVPIVELILTAWEGFTALLHELCVDVAAPGKGGMLESYDAGGGLLERAEARDGRAVVRGEDVARVVVKGDGGLCLFRICVLVGLDAVERLRWQGMAQHTLEGLARWSADSEVLAPYQTFRLRIATTIDVQVPGDSKVAGSFAGRRDMVQLAYFRTEGPPGLAALAQPGNALVPGAGSGGAAPPAVETGLEDLSRYVAQTVPPTVPPPGRPPVLPRPVYRAYDVGVVFNANHVDAMYALAGRDLSLVLYDTNDRPVRDAAGLLAVRPNTWGRTDQLSLTESERRWLELVDGADCTAQSIDLGTVARNKRVSASGFVLDPETVYEARLIPLLAVDDFSAYVLGASASGSGASLVGRAPHGWTALDVGTSSAPSTWRIAESGTMADRYLEQNAAISSGPSRRDRPFPGGTLLLRADTPQLPAAHPDQPSAWTDYHLTGVLRAAGTGLIGLGVRMLGRRGYLVTLDRQRGRRRLLRVGTSGAVILAEAPGGYAANSDMQLSIECSGSRLRVHLDGEPLFDVANTVHSRGTIALYTGANSGARFTEVRVDDLRRSAPVAYRFHFTTSAFADATHHLQAGDGGRRSVAMPMAELAAATATAIGMAAPAAATPPGEEEARRFTAIADAALGAAARQPIAAPDVIRLTTAAGATAALLVRTAEPLDWTRISLATSAAGAVPAPKPAKAVLIARARFTTATPADPSAESATLLLLEPRDLTGHVLQRRTLPSPGAPPMEDGAPLAEVDFLTDQTIGAAVPTPLWQPDFNGLGGLSLVVPPGTGMPAWSGNAGRLTQDAAFATPDGAASGAPLEQPSTGTLAVGAPFTESDIRIALNLTLLDPNGMAGVVFRYTDPANCYRFTLDRLRGRRVLSRFVGGVFTVLHSSALPAAATSFALEIEAMGSRLSVRVDGALVVSLLDASHTAGAVGFHSFRQPRARFADVVVERIPNNLGAWRIQDVSAQGDRGHWAIAYGTLAMAASPAPAVGESFALLDAAGPWADLRFAAVVQARGGSGQVGLVWRHLSPQTQLLLAFDAAAGTVRIVSRQGGAESVLWSGIITGTAWAVEVVAIGRRLRLVLDGVQVADISNVPLGSGTIGAFATMGAGVEIGPPRITHAAPSFEQWHVFGAIGQRSSGRRLRVVSGAEAPGASAPPGEEQIWKGQAAASFRPAFPAEGVDLRLLDPTGAVLHERRFQPDGTYAPFGGAILRAADGTGFILLPVGAAALPDGELRLDFTFRRDILSQDKDSLVLRQEGDSSDELISVFVG